MGMLIKRGIAVSPGITISPAVLVDVKQASVPRETVPASGVSGELRRLQSAVEAAVKELEELKAQAAATIGSELAEIFSFHARMLRDEELMERIRGRINGDSVTAEYGVYAVGNQWASRFRQSESALVRERASDIEDMMGRLLRHLGHGTRPGQALDQLTQPSVIVARDLTPSQTASLDRATVRGLITDAGGQTSHTAILAHALGIPAVVGLEDVTRDIREGDTVVVDGNAGVVVIRPDAEKLLEYRQQAEKVTAFEATLDELADLPAQTRDGTSIDLLANIEFPREAPEAVRKGAAGVGLYRTEMLFLAQRAAPDEEAQYRAYREAIEAMAGRVLTIRTLDLGADKMTQSMIDSGEWHERNPFLGCRSIRLCLQNLPLFKTQLRAVLRASVHGPVRIMFPLISNIMELRQSRMVLADVKEDLEDHGVAFAEDVPVGIMIEVPSVALQVKLFAGECDFFSIGTNDLIQYTVAVDRSNERIASLYSGANPAVLMLIRDILRTAQREKTPVSLCGEMAGDPVFTMLLLGLGLRSFSMTPPAIPEVKKVVRSVSIEQCKRVARKVISMESDRQVMNFLRDEMRKITPEVYAQRDYAY